MSWINNINPKKIIYLDESGIDECLYNKYARAKRGKKIYGEVSGKRYARRSIIAALLGKKILAPLVFEGYTDTNIFNQWLEECLIPEMPPGCIVVMDNASFHKSKKTVQLIESANCKPIFLPPYSPDLNPIENWWAIIKRQPCTFVEL